MASPKSVIEVKPRPARCANLNVVRGRHSADDLHQLRMVASVLAKAIDEEAYPPVCPIHLTELAEGVYELCLTPRIEDTTIWRVAPFGTESWSQLWPLIQNLQKKRSKESFLRLLDRSAWTPEVVSGSDKVIRPCPFLQEASRIRVACEKLHQVDFPDPALPAIQYTPPFSWSHLTNLEGVFSSKSTPAYYCGLPQRRILVP